MSPNFFSNAVALLESLPISWKGQTIFENHKDVPNDKLSYVIVQDIARPSSIDKMMQSDPPLGTYY